MADNKIKPKRGLLLIADPFLHDTYFKRSVILLAEHNKHGSFGFMLNKPIHLKLNDALSNFPEYKDPLYLGGPVNKDQLFYIHTLGDVIEESTEIAKGLYWGGNLKTITKLIKGNKINSSQLRFFAGYSGWDGNQLDEELKEKSWIICKSTVEHIMSNDTDNLWKNLLTTTGNKYAVMANFPENPSLN